jgi:hypothetical protein
MNTPSAAAPASQLSAVQHVVHLMLENRSFDYMLGFLYADSGSVSSAGAAFEELTERESNPDAKGDPVSVFKIGPADAGAYFMPGADPGEGYAKTNSQLFGSDSAPVPPVATKQGFLTNFDATMAWAQRVGRSVHPTRRRRASWASSPGGAAGAVEAGPRLRGLRSLVRLGADRDVPEPGVRVRGDTWKTTRGSR